METEISEDGSHAKESNWVYDDGGRIQAGYKGGTGDCVTRAIAIASGKPYKEVYDELFKRGKEYGESHRSQVAKSLKKRGASPRDGVFADVYRPYIESIGGKWVPTMQVGQGCKVHLKPEELPQGRIIARVSKHLVAVVDGVIHDTHDPSREGTRCVYGYWEFA